MELAERNREAELSLPATVVMGFARNCNLHERIEPHMAQAAAEDSW